MKIIKRDGRVVDYDGGKIINAIIKAMTETKDGIDMKLAKKIESEIKEEIKIGFAPMSVENIQDLIEDRLMSSDRKDVAKKYILYREERNKIRSKDMGEKYTFLSKEFLSKYKHMSDPFPFELGKFVYYRTYSRPIPEEQRRERWWETCARVIDFNFGLQVNAMKKQGLVVTEAMINKLRKEAEIAYDMMYNLKLFTSGRTLWIGGTQPAYSYALSNFNCSFVTIDSLKKFSEIFFVLMLGTGVGLSVERKYIKKLPKINSKIKIIHKDFQPVPANQRNEYTELKMLGKNSLEIVVGDSKFGWAKAIEFFFDILSAKQYEGVEFLLINYDNVRPKGERIKTFGGYASGYQAIKKMFKKIDNLIIKKKEIDNKQWQTLKPIDCLDIATIIAENVVSGGVRRSALIVFCDSDEEEVLNAKSNLYYQDENGNWISNDEILHRMLSNNTVLYKEKPTREQLHKHFETIKVSGEPGFGNMQEMLRRRGDVQGGNPCFEILLRDRGVCNLTEVNMMGFVNSDGSYDREKLLEAQKLSARIGYRMATIELELNDWDLVNKEDRLTGCSLTGMMDFVNATGISKEELKELLRELREIAHQETNKLAEELRLNKPKLVTAIKPSGTISQLPTVSSGVHFSHSPYYIRRIRINAEDPLAKAMIASGFNWYPEVGQTVENHSTKVFEFPIKAPKGKTKYDVSAIEQLELYKLVMENYVDHNASNTIHVRPNEWEEVEEWVYDNWDSIVGVTFLPLDNSFYQLMPYEAISEEKYNEMIKSTPSFNPSILKEFENFMEEFDLDESDCDSGVCPIK